ncbi:MULTISPECIES: DUF317 domain-containing protein [unclassified Streptomyces]|uniref:DUF317 domain-containing protein n=1 Tax=unclassified Streptomyces TaxID=2593676 RepID=UPI00081BB616|nr:MULTISPECIES: DUF317 domain-containing protein [unclassified Streptomyces]MYQ82614.1 DUF317 domain-containing protein [Streptomyces sp. SID4936]SCD47120.1 protein of unknown function [Streptomyces sp. DvalAA-43]
MPLDPFNDLDPDQTVNVLPRRLAGPGALDLHTVWPFPFDDGWHLHPADAGMVFASSPCARLWTRFAPEPEKRGKGTWTIGASRVPFGELTWQTVFDATTPAELLRDVHAELLDLYDQGRLFDGATERYEGYALLLDRGWSHNVKTSDIQTFLAPDLLGGVHQYVNRAADRPEWRVWGGDIWEPDWSAELSSGTPTALVAAFTASLVSTEPVQRAVRDLPVHARQHLYMATPTAKRPPGCSPVALPFSGPVPGRAR